MEKRTQILDLEDNCVEVNALNRTRKSYYILMLETEARTQICLQYSRITLQSWVNLKEISLKAYYLNVSELLQSRIISNKKETFTTAI